MKNLLFILFAGILVLGTVSCKKIVCEPPVADCIDESKIRRDAACTLEYDPVCGCDGKTYENPCLADINGVTSWTKGRCEEDKGPK